MFCKNPVRKIILIGAMYACSYPLSASAMDFSLDGFGSAYYGQAYSNNVLPYGFKDNSANFTEFSLIGLNIKSKIDDHFSFAAQLVASGQSEIPNSNYSLFADWAYINYTPMDNLSIRVGRQRLPIFTASEYINEHIDLPFRVMPEIVYQISPFDSFDGVMVNQTIDLGEQKLQVGVFGGTPVLNIGLQTSYPALGVPLNYTYNGADLLGAKVTLDGDGWRVRAQASRATQTLGLNIELPAALGGSSSLFQAHQETYSVGYRYDKHNIVSWGEYVYATSPDGTNVPASSTTTGGPFVGKSKAGYVLAGYRIGDWMPRYTFAQASVQAGYTAGETTTHTIGVNYQASKKVILKAETEIDMVGNGAYEVTLPNGAIMGNGVAGYIGADFVF